ncbi:MAG TPA: Ig-like domain-containing protein, partial [Candidatus Saccharimonadales bacterium]
MRLFVLAIVGIYFTFAAQVQAADFAYDQTLTVAGTTANNRFGEVVAATSTYLAAGSPIDDTLGTDAGAVYLYEKVGNTWTYRQKITASDGAAGDQFGASLAMNGTTLTVGSPYDDLTTTTDAGSVYSFDLEDGTWLQTEKLTMQTPVNYERFGTAVDMTSTRLVVGVPGYNGATSATSFGRGAVSVWDRQGINWGNQYLYTYTSPVSATRPAGFGYSVAISGDKIAAGAPRDYAATSGQGSNAGSMSVLAYNSGTSTWVSEGRFYSNAPVSSDFYGNSVDIQGNTLVTANYNISQTTPKIFTHTYSGGAWSSANVIVPTSASTARRYIGQAVEIAPDQTSILVGSYVTYVTTDFVGRVFVLKPNETTGVWEQTQDIASPDAPTSAGWFGYDVAYAGSAPVIASPMVTAVTNTRGAIYTYNQGDGTPPTLALSSSSPQYVRNPYTVTVDTSEPVVGFTQDDISITSGATLSNFTQVNSTQYTVLVTPSTDKSYTMSIDAGKMQDAAGNNNTASPTLIRTYDSTAPAAAVLTPTQSTYFSSSTINSSVRITDANGNLSGLAADDISISNGTISNFSTSSDISSITGTFTITPTSQGPINFYVKTGAVTDQAGNDSTASAMRIIYYDADKPTPSFSTTLNPTNQSPFQATLSFDEPVADIQDVSAGQIGISGGSISNFQRVTSQQYTFDVTPTGVGTVTLSYAAGQVNDRAGNSNNAASNLDVEFDNFGSEVTISSTANNPTNQSPIPFTITLSEPVTGLTADDFTVINGVAGTLTQESSTIYSLSVTPDTGGDVSLHLPAQKATDGVGNGNQASNTETVTYDQTRPSTTISHSYTPPTNASPLVYTIRFSESVSDLDGSSINLTNASLVSLVKVDAREYTLSVTPNDGTVTVEVPAGAVQDAASNQNTAASSSLKSDRTAPTGTVNTLRSGNTRPGISGTISESADAVAVTIDGTTFNASIDNDDHTWSVGSNLFGPLADGVYDVTLSITDLAGNVGSDTTTDELTIDTDYPTITINSPGATTNQNPMSFDLMSNRNINGLDTSDLIVTNGTVAEITETDRSNFIVKVTPQ